MLPKLQPFTKPRNPGFIERFEVAILEVIRKRWTRSRIKDGFMFQPKRNVMDDESLELDRPLEGGNLGYLLLKGLQLKYDMSVEKVKVDAAVHAVSILVACLSLSLIATLFC